MAGTVKEMSLIKQVLLLKQLGESNRGIARKLPINKERCERLSPEYASCGHSARTSCCACSRPLRPVSRSAYWRSPGQGACGSKRTTRGTNTGFSVNLESPSRYCMYGFSWIARMVFSSLKFSICFTIKAPTTMRAGLLPAPQWLFLRRLLCSFPILVQGRRSASLTQRLDLLNPERDSWS